MERASVDTEEVRRIFTILFTDIVSSSAIAADLDPEDWRFIVAPLHKMAGEAVQDYGGTVVQYLGDGLLALFGVLHSSERDPERAVSTALEIQAKIPSLEFDVSIQLRIGIHTGLVVMGQLGSDAKREFTASGDAMNIAARLESSAPPGGVLISRSTYRHIRGLFEMTLQPPLTVKGIRDPLETYIVVKKSTRLYRTIARGVVGVETSTVGREGEIGQLFSAYEQARDKDEIVWTQLLGGPGMGKSRLIADASEMVD